MVGVVDAYLTLTEVLTTGEITKSDYKLIEEFIEEVKEEKPRLGRKLSELFEKIKPLIVAREKISKEEKLILDEIRHLIHLEYGEEIKKRGESNWTIGIQYEQLDNLFDKELAFLLKNVESINEEAYEVSCPSPYSCSFRLVPEFTDGAVLGAVSFEINPIGRKAKIHMWMETDDELSGCEMIHFLCEKYFRNSVVCDFANPYTYGTWEDGEYEYVHEVEISREEDKELINDILEIIRDVVKCEVKEVSENKVVFTCDENVEYNYEYCYYLSQLLLDKYEDIISKIPTDYLRYTVKEIEEGTPMRCEREGEVHYHEPYGFHLHVACSGEEEFDISKPEEYLKFMEKLVKYLDILAYDIPCLLE